MFPDPQSLQIVLLILSIVFLLLSFKNNIYGVISYFIILTAKLGDRYPELGAIRFELIAAVIVFISILIRGNIKKFFEDLSNKLNKTLLIFFFIGMLSMLQAVNMEESWRLGGYPLIKLMLFYIMIVSSVNNMVDLKKLVWSVVLITAWIAYEPIANYFRGMADELYYGTVAAGDYGVARGHVALANTILQSMPLVFYFALSQKNIAKKGWLWIIFGLLVIGVVLSKSRGGFVGLIALAASLFYLSQNKGKAFIALLLIFIFLLPLAGEQYLEHMSSITDGIFASRSSSDRYLGLKNGIEMMIKRPLLGVGIGCFAEARRQFFSYYFYSHNLYGELLGELGIMSFTWFLWIFLIFRRTSFLKGLLERENEDENIYYQILTGVQVSLFIRLVLGNFTHGWYIWFWFVMGAIVVCIDNILKKELQAMEEEIEEPEEQILSGQPLAGESESTSLN